VVEGETIDKDVSSRWEIDLTRGCSVNPNITRPNSPPWQQAKREQKSLDQPARAAAALDVRIRSGSKG
jgi:hypothetical protein